MGVGENKVFIVIVATNIATDISDVATGCAKHENVKAEVVTGCAKHGNVKAEVTTAKAEVVTGCAKHGNVKAEVTTAKAEVVTVAVSCCSSFLNSN